MSQNSNSNVPAWIEILTTLGTEEVARILDKSATIEEALEEATANARQAKAEAQDLRNEGHEND